MDGERVSTTRFYQKYNDFGQLIMDGQKTQSMRIWTERTIVEFERRAQDRGLVLLGGRSGTSCWGYGRITKVVRNYLAHNMTRNDLICEGAPEGMSCKEFIKRHVSVEASCDKSFEVTQVHFVYVSLGTFKTVSSFVNIVCNYIGTMPKRKSIVVSSDSEDTETNGDEENEGDEVEGEAAESDGEENLFMSAVAVGATISKNHVRNFVKLFPSEVQETLMATVEHLKDNVEVC